MIPILGTMLGAGVGAFSFLFTAVLSSFTVAVAWVFVRPLLGASLLIVTIGALVWLLKVGRRRKVERAGAAAAAQATA